MMEQRGSGELIDEGWNGSGPSLSVNQLIGCIDAPVVLLDLTGHVYFLSPSAERALGRRSKDCAGTALEDLFTGHPDVGRERLKQAVSKCLSGVPDQASAVLTTSRGKLRAHCTFIPTSGEHGLVDGVLVLLHVDTSPAAKGADGQDLESSIQVLAKTSAEMIENTDLKELIEDEAARLVTSLTLDFAVFRIAAPDEKPLMLCHGIDYKEARELLESRLADGTPLYQGVTQGRDVLVCDMGTTQEIACPLSDVASLAGLTIRWSDKAYGCAVFGTKTPGRDIGSDHPVLQVFCNQVGVSLRNAKLYRELKLRNTELKGLNDTFQALSSTLEVQEVLSLILQTARGLVGAENSFIFKLDPVRGKLRLLSKIARPGIAEDLELDVGEGITGHVAQTGKGMLVERADLDPRSAQVPGTPEEEPSSIICVPLRFMDRMLGVMTLEKTPGVPFDQKQYELIEMFSLQAAMALHNASLYDQIKGYASNLQMYNVLLTHDVANFNVPIHGFLEILLKDPKLDDRERRYVRSALVQSDNISELITDVRELSRLRSRLGEMPLEPVDMVPVISEAKEDIFSNPVYEDVETRLVCPMASAVTMADAFLKDLFYNLMSNACKYGQGRPVEIGIAEAEVNGKAMWRVQIADEGKGIPDERKANLFRRFDHLDTETGSDGHGLGLSVVSALCDRYGGRVWVENRVPEDHTKGSVFIVLLPKATRPNGGA